MLLRRWAPCVTLLAVVSGSSCNDFALPKVETAATAVDAACMDLITRVFTASGFVPVSLVPNGPPMLFAPRTTGPLSFSMTLGWAMGVSFPTGGEGDSRTCNFRLQTLSVEPDCMPQACLPLMREGHSAGTAFDDAAAVMPMGTISANPGLGTQDPGCYGLSPTCPLSPIGGVQYGKAQMEMTRRIREALRRTEAPHP